jgi:hypothetical protein
MALQKTISTATGYEANYHIVSDVNISFKKRNCEVLVLGFKDEATRQQPNAQPLWGKRFDWRGQRFVFSNAPDAEPLWKQVYDALKELPEFENAQDV